jgi:hypothetical protein
VVGHILPAHKMQFRMVAITVVLPKRTLLTQQRHVRFIIHMVVLHLNAFCIAIVPQARFVQHVPQARFVREEL